MFVVVLVVNLVSIYRDLVCVCFYFNYKYS